MSDRARAELLALPGTLRQLDGEGPACTVAYSAGCRAALEAVDARASQ